MLTYARVLANSSVGISFLVKRNLFYVCQTAIFGIFHRFNNTLKDLQKGELLL